MNTCRDQVCQSKLRRDGPRALCGRITPAFLGATVRKKFDIEWCQDYARIRGGECLSPEYKGVHTALEYRCAVGHVWHARPAKHIYEGSWCPQCLSGKPVPEDEVRALVESRGLTLLGGFKGSKEKMTLQCSNGHLWHCTLVNFKNTKHGCPDCSQVADTYARTKTRKYTAKDIRARASMHLGTCLTLAEAPDDYRIATKDRGRFRCADGHEWETLFSSIIRGHWCPQCAFGAGRA